jgi:ribosomal protein L31E
MNEMVDRILTINLRNYLVMQPRPKRARKAVAYIRDRVAHYTKIKPENIKLGYDLNALIFKHYARRMSPVKVRVKIGTDTADVLPFTEETKKAVAPKTEAKGTPKEAKKEEKKAEKKEEKKEEKKPFIKIQKTEQQQNTEKK